MFYIQLLIKVLLFHSTKVCLTLTENCNTKVHFSQVTVCMNLNNISSWVFDTSHLEYITYLTHKLKSVFSKHTYQEYISWDLPNTPIMLATPKLFPCSG